MEKEELNNREITNNTRQMEGQNQPEIITNSMYTPAFFKKSNRKTSKNRILNRNK